MRNSTTAESLSHLLKKHKQTWMERKTVLFLSKENALTFALKKGEFFAGESGKQKTVLI